MRKNQRTQRYANDFFDVKEDFLICHKRLNTKVLVLDIE